MGIPAGKLAIGAMVLSGALCGIVGLLEVYGIHRRYVETLSTGFYFDGMLVAMIMRYRPLGIILMSLFFGALKIGSSAMELNAGISSELVLIVQSIIIFFMAAQGGIMRSLREKRERRRARKVLSKRKEGEGAAL
jgi:simple sugar transport system permease protein